MNEDKPKPEPGEHYILTEHCNNRDRLLYVVGFLADQERSMCITTNASIGWDVAYNTGPSRT